MPIQPRSIRGKVPYDVEKLIEDLISTVNQQEAALTALRNTPPQLISNRPAIVLGGSGNGATLDVDPNGALDNPPLAVRVDGVSVIINGSNQLEAPGAAGGITELTGDVTAGPGSGSEVATLSNTGVAAGTYGNGTNVGQFTVNAKGRISTASNVPITFPGGSGGLIAKTVLTSGTVATHTFNANTRSAFVQVQGPGGGGGGGDQGAAQSGAGAGGGGGGYDEQWYIGLSGGEAIEYTVGLAGTGGAAGNNAGNPGTTATVWDINAEIGATITCNVGTGGASMAAGTTLAAAAGGAGGTATGGYLNIQGQAGDQSLRTANNIFFAGRGANSMLGFGGCYLTSGAGQTARGYGAGGSGGSVFSGTADVAGGDGRLGVIIIWEFS